MTAVYLAVIIIGRFGFGMDMALDPLLRMFFIYELLGLILIVVMIIGDFRFCRAAGIERDMNFFFIGLITSAACGFVDCIIYIAGIRSVSGYAQFSRVGAYVFFMSMGEAVENAVKNVLSKGYRTADIMSEGKTLVGTVEMGELVKAEL